MTFRFIFKMSSGQLFFVPARFISRSSCIWIKVLGKGLHPPKPHVNLNEKPSVSVETNTEKLANYVCGSNLFIEGEDVKLKPDSEYPDWLWSMHAPLPLEELDKNSKTYWFRVIEQREREIRYLDSLQKNTYVHK